MTRPLRIEYENALYHVTCRGNGGEAVFRDEKDRRRFLDSLAESLNLFRVELHCYVLMVNHFHFLLRTLEANLSRFMQRFNTSYTAYFNLRHQRKGHLYQGRFKAILVEEDEYLLELSRYIHLNPVRVKKYQGASLEEKLAILKRYKWSSFMGYINKGRRDSFVRYRDVLSYLGGDTREGRERYRNFVLSGIEKRLLNPLEEAKAGLILGSEGFISWVRENFLDDREPLSRDYTGLPSVRRIVPIRDIAVEVAREYGVEINDLLGRSYSRSEARKVLVEVSYRLNIKSRSLRWLGRELGGISGEAVYSMHRRVQEMALGDRSFRRRIEKITARLKS